MDDDVLEEISEEAPGSPLEEVRVQAETVDEEALRDRYRLAARRTVEERIQAESLEATVLPTKQEDGRPKSCCRIILWFLAFLLVVIGSVGIGVGVVWKNRNHDMQQESELPPPPPTSLPPPPPAASSLPPTVRVVNDIEFLQRKLYDLSISNDVIFNETSTQYKAVQWLVLEDPAMLHIQSRAQSQRLLIDISSSFSTFRPKVGNGM